MKLTVPILILACLIGLGIIFYLGNVNEYHTQAQVVEDKQTALGEPAGTGGKTMNGLEADPGRPQPSSASLPSLEDLWLEAMDVPSDRQLIMAEFRKRGGVVKEEALEKDINSIVRDHFGNDRSAFEANLQSKGLSLEEFKRQRHDMMAVHGVQSYITRGITDPVQKKEKVEEWLRGLRKSASPGAAVSEED